MVPRAIPADAPNTKTGSARLTRPRSGANPCRKGFSALEDLELCPERSRSRSAGRGCDQPSTQGSGDGSTALGPSSSSFGTSEGSRDWIAPPGLFSSPAYSSEGSPVAGIAAAAGLQMHVGGSNNDHEGEQLQVGNLRVFRDRYFLDAEEAESMMDISDISRSSEVAGPVTSEGAGHEGAELGRDQAPRAAEGDDLCAPLDAVTATEDTDGPEDEWLDVDCSSGSYEAPGAVPEPAPVVKPASPKKDDIVHFDWRAGMLLSSRYEVTKLLGDGTFGRVLQVKGANAGDPPMAVKVIRHVEKYIRNAKREAEILKDIQEADDMRSSSCVRLHTTFWHETDDHRRFLCLAFEVLGESLYDLLKQNQFRGLWVQDVQSIARQCLEALMFLHEELNLTHTDLKLENVLFVRTEPHRPAHFPREAAYLRQHKQMQGKLAQYVRPVSARIKLIDFGNSTYELDHHSSVINTRQYRAPEVILAMGWNELSDIWSMGCIIMEMYTGELLFRTHDSLEHLALMEQALHILPASMLNAASPVRRAQLLHEDADGEGLRVYWPERAPSNTSEQRVRSQPPLEDLVADEHRRLADFISSLLILDPHRRPTAAAALGHPFLYDIFND